MIFNAVAIPISLFKSVLIARVLGATGKGSYDLILSTTSLLSITLGLSLRSGITYTVASKNINIEKLFPKLILFGFCQSLIAMAIVFFIKNHDISTTFIPLALSYWSIIIVPLLLFITATNGYLASILIGLKKNILLNNIFFLEKIIFLVLIFLGVGITYFLKLVPNPFLLIALNLLSLLIVFFVLCRVIQVRNKSFYCSQKKSTPNDLKAFRLIFAYSLPCYFGNLLQFLNYKIDVFIVSFFTSVSQLGLYTLAVSLAQLIWLISNSCSTVLLPKIANDRLNGNKTIAYTTQITRIILFLSIVASMGLAIFIFLMLPVLYGENFRGSIVPFMILLPGITFFSIARILAAYMAGVGQPQVNTIASSFGFIGTIIFDLLLIPQYGIIGAAIASTISYSISTIFLIYFFARKCQQKITHLFIIQLKDIYLCISVIKQFSKNVFISD